ncbi:MAG: hypothetical protein HOQ07_07325 [Sinomonas sp.]|nr:hypothetical protein [Sinomonas sp.]
MATFHPTRGHHSPGGLAVARCAVNVPVVAVVGHNALSREIGRAARCESPTIYALDGEA